MVRIILLLEREKILTGLRKPFEVPRGIMAQ